MCITRLQIHSKVQFCLTVAIKPFKNCSSDYLFKSEDTGPKTVNPQLIFVGRTPFSISTLLCDTGRCHSWMSSWPVALLETQ